MTRIAPSRLLTNAGRRERDATGLVIQPGHWVQRLDSTRQVLQVIGRYESIERVSTFECQDGHGFYFGVDGPDVTIVPEPGWAHTERLALAYGVSPLLTNRRAARKAEVAERDALDAPPPKPVPIDPLDAAETVTTLEESDGG